MCNLQHVYLIFKATNVVIHRIRVYQRHGSLICYVVDEGDEKTLLKCLYFSNGDTAGQPEWKNRRLSRIKWKFCCGLTVLI